LKIKAENSRSRFSADWFIAESHISIEDVANRKLFLFHCLQLAPGDFCFVGFGVFLDELPEKQFGTGLVVELIKSQGLS
jgi:hypothetical protein